MGFLRALVRLPLLFWLAIIGGYLVWNYMTWQSEQLVPLQQQVAASQQQLVRVQKSNREAETFEKERDARFQELQTLAEEFNQALEKLPRSSDTPGLLSNLAEIADRVGVEFTRFEPGRPEQSGFLMETPFKIELKGSFVQIMSFLDEVAHLKRIVTSKSLILKDPILRGSAAVLKAETVLVTYFFDENGKAAANATAPQSSTPDAAPTTAPPPTGGEQSSSASEEKKGP